MTEQLCQKPDIFRIFVPLPDNPLKNLNCYVIRSEGESLIIDTGFNRPECKEALVDGLKELDVDLCHARLFLTHLHGDHTGLTEYFTDQGVTAYMHRIDYDYLKNNLSGSNWRRMEQRFIEEGFPYEEMQKQLTGNQARLYSPKHLFPVTTVQDGDCVTVGSVKLRCIHTPGHTPGHVCLYIENEKILFSGDHVLFDITPNISIWNDVPASLADYMDSLTRMQKLEVMRTFPGHREFAGDFHKRIDTLIAHHYQRLQEILSAVAAHPDCNAYETAGRITWSARGRAWEDFSPNQKWFAMGETLAHLKWLLDRQSITQSEDKRYTAIRTTL